MVVRLLLVLDRICVYRLRGSKQERKVQNFENGRKCRWNWWNTKGNSEMEMTVGAEYLVAHIP